MLLKGRYPQQGSTDEILVNERAVERYGFDVGDRTDVAGLRSFQSRDTFPLGEAVVVGVVRVIFDLVDDPATDSFLLAAPSFVDGRWQEAELTGAIVSIGVRDRDDASELVSELSREVVRGDVLGTAGILEISRRATTLQARGLLLAAVVVLLVGLVAIVQAVGRHLAPRREDTEVLAAMGLAPALRTRGALIAVGPALVGGAALGLVIAVLVSPLLPLGIARRAEPDPGLHADWLILAIGFVVAVCASAAATALIVRRWGRAADAGSSSRPALMARLSERWGLRPAPSAGAQLALAPGGGRARLPVVPTVAVLIATVTISTAAVIVRSSLDGLFADDVRYGQPWDVLLAGEGAAPRDDARRLADDDRVAGVEIGHTGELNTIGADGAERQIFTVGLDGASGPMYLGVLDGRAPGGPGEIALGTTTMRALGLDVGDETTISGPCGERRVEVVGRVIVPLFLFEDSDEGSVVQLATFDELCAGQLIAQIDEVEGVAVRLEDSSDAATMAAELTAEGRFAQVTSIVPSSVATLADVRSVPAIVVASIGLLGIVAGGHALIVAVRRRRHDLAVLRALGMRPGDVRRVVGWQAVTMAVVALAVGIPAGVVLGRLVWMSIAEPSNVLVRVDVDALELGALVLGGLAIMLVLAIWPSRRAARLRPADALRTE